MGQRLPREGVPAAARPPGPPRRTAQRGLRLPRGGRRAPGLPKADPRRGLTGEAWPPWPFARSKHCVFVCELHGGTD